MRYGHGLSAKPICLLTTGQLCKQYVPTKKPSLTPEVRTFIVLARQLYGEKWKGPTAYALGVRRDTLNKIAKGRRELHPGLLMQLQLHYEEETSHDQQNSS